MKLHEEIQSKYFTIYDELIVKNLIERKLDTTVWRITREHETETWNSKLRLITDIKTNFDIAPHIIKYSETEQAIIEVENIFLKILFVNVNVLMSASTKFFKK